MLVIYYPGCIKFLSTLIPHELQLYLSTMSFNSYIARWNDTINRKSNFQEWGPTLSQLFSKVINIRSDLMISMIKFKKLPCFRLKISTASKERKTSETQLQKLNHFLRKHIYSSNFRAPSVLGLLIQHRVGKEWAKIKDKILLWAGELSFQQQRKLVPWSIPKSMKKNQSDMEACVLSLYWCTTYLAVAQNMWCSQPRAHLLTCCLGKDSLLHCSDLLSD